VALWGRGEVHSFFVGKPEAKRPLGRPRHRWEDLLKWIISGMGGMHWIDLAQDMDKWQAVVNVVMNLQVS
jgi:hypothetical protein